MKKKLLFLTLPPPYGGGEIRNYHLNNFFNSKISFFIINSTNKLSNKNRQGKVLLFNVLFGIKIIFKLFCRILKIKPYLLYLSLPKNFFPFIRTSLIILFAYFQKIKVVGDLAGMDFYFLNRGNLARKFGLYVLRKVTRIRLLGESIKTKMVSEYNLENCIVFDNGIALPEQLKIKSKDFSSYYNFLYCGALNEKKGVKLIIESIKNILEKKTDVKFTFLGEWNDDELKQWTKNYVKNNEIEKYVEFPGKIVDEKKWEYFQKAHIYLQISYLDGQPLSILEAMGFGLPIIASRVGAIPDTVINNRNGILLEKLDTKNVSYAINCLLDDKIKCVKMSNNNLEDFKKRFSLDIYLQNVKNMLEGI